MKTFLIPITFECTKTLRIKASDIVTAIRRAERLKKVPSGAYKVVHESIQVAVEPAYELAGFCCVCRGNREKNECVCEQSS